MTHMLHRWLILFSMVTLVVAGASAPRLAVSWQDKVDPWVMQAAAQGEAEFLVFLSTQSDLSAARQLSTKLEKGRYVYQALTSLAERSQAPLIAELTRLGVEYHPYWIANLLWVRGDLGTIQLLASRPDVAHLYANPHITLQAPISRVASLAQPAGVEWNITWVNAPQVWALGFTGQGAVIGGQDTGYIWDHPALKSQYRGWDGADASHDYNWYDATAQHSPLPVDPHGHGTHTMGTMVGDDGSGNQIGMAPGARWIGCRNMDTSGTGSPETYIVCYQWFVAPTRVDGSDPRPDLAPDVINNSWSCPVREGCTDPGVLQSVVANLVAAGIVTAHSAGNSGSAGCGSINTPAAIYAESFTVGATDFQSDTIAAFSSRGPITVDGSNLPKPDISAPGVSVRSSSHDGGYALMTGTSMAAPHAAGLVALLISAQPALRGQVDQIEVTIQQTALHIPSTDCSSNGVPNNVYGWGRIDALAAVESVQTLTLQKAASASRIEPGGILIYTLILTSLNEITPTTNLVLSDTLPASTTFISATPPYSQTAGIIRWEFTSLAPLESISVDLAVRVDASSTGSITNADYFARSDQAPPVRGLPVSTLIRRIHFVPLFLNP